MATRTFLSPDQIIEAKKHWPGRSPSSAVSELSHWLGELVFSELQQIQGWQLAEPIALGSWARGELCPSSDIDLIFVGSQEKALRVVEHFSQKAWPVRYRIPEDPSDWTVGVEDADVWALLSAKALTPSAELKLKGQVDRVNKLLKTKRASWLARIAQERRDRKLRYDSIVNYLEPNIKFGPGGLRDLEQALTLWGIRSGHLQERKDVWARLNEFKTFLLWVRQGLHLLGFQDVLNASVQSDLARALNFSDERAFMSHLQKTLSEGEFYADWVAQGLRAPKSLLLGEVGQLELAKAFGRLKAAPPKTRTLIEEQVSRQKIVLPKSKKQAAVIGDYLNADASEDLLISAFRSRLMAHVFPDLKRVIGLVQHDQYHRFSVDAHLLQVLRQVVRAKRRPQMYGANLAKVIRSFKKSDWEVLFWTAFFHDLWKGRRGSHSEIGAREVKRVMTSMGFSLRLTVEVSWMVRSHLLMSRAAFRHNPKDARTWQMLFDQGVRRQRITRLGVFTALDIRGTNPDAWNSWKENLLSDLIQSLQSPRASGVLSFIEDLEKKNLKKDMGFLTALDPRLFEVIPAHKLAKDSLSLGSKGAPAPLLIHPGKSGEYWIRFHWPKDEPGLFLKMVRALHAMGASIQEAYVQSFSKQGVYDWFRIRSTKGAAQVRKLLGHFLYQQKGEEGPLPKVYFQKIELIPIDDNEFLISFRGRDQRGALLVAATAIFRGGLPIKWAKLNTWGRQIDDVFSVQCTSDKAQAFVQQARETLMDPSKS